MHLRKLPTAIFSLADAKTYEAATIYHNLRHEYGVNPRIEICAIEVVDKKVIFRSKSAVLPDKADMVSTFCPPGFNTFEMHITCLQERHPEERLTREQFVIELLDLWRERSAKLPERLQKTVGHDFEVAESVLRGTYALSDLSTMSFELLEEQLLNPARYMLPVCSPSTP